MKLPPSSTQTTSSKCKLETKTPYYPKARERGCLPFPSPATAGQIDKSLERGPQIRQSSRTAYGIVYYDAPLLSHGEAERLSTIPPPLQRPVDSIARKRPSNSPAVEDSFWDYQIKRAAISNSIQLASLRKARTFETLTLP